MKLLYTLAIMFLLLDTTAFSQVQNNKHIAGSLAQLTNNSSGRSLNAATDEWLDRAQQYIKETEYHFKNDGNSTTFYGANKVQHLQFAITPSGYSISPLQFSAEKKESSNWQEDLSFSELRRGDDHIAIGDGATISRNNSFLTYQYPNFSVEFINSEKGLRQNFIIQNKPAGNGDLQVVLKLKGDLSASLLNNGIQFKDKTGATKLFYTDLNVWDADHRVINASMQLTDKNTLAIVVNDKDANYPLTIDPINKTPEWTTSADGVLPSLVGQLAVDAAYGFTVAGLGDVNGDGYDDVAIGAPTLADVISGTGTLASVGAVFVYYGSSSGLSTVPAAVLQPTTPVAGALFGYSIAGGDINNDSKADIIVGAPMDVVSITVGGGGTASGTVGKVYVYSGATLSTGVSPFLQLQLSGNGILENGVNLSVKALFGFSVAVTQDLNGDNNNDIIVGAPAYAGIKTGLLGNSLLDVQSGGAFVFLSNTNGTHSLTKLKPIESGLLGLPILQSNINGLLFGYSVDGLGDYNGDGKPDVIASAPAGIDLSSLGAILNGKLLQGSATVYYGTGTGINVNPGATLVATSGGLLTNITGTIANIANMFGTAVRGVKNPDGTRNGNVLVGAPLGGDVFNILSLKLKTGTVSVFKKKASSPNGDVIPDQVLASPRNSNTILGIIQSNLLFGYSLDNTLDINCDGYSDIIVGEPASSGVQLLNANVSGGAAYVYLGNSTGTYQTSPFWTLTATEDAFLGVNATSLIGYSVAGAGHVKGVNNANKVLIGTPSRTLDFGSGLLNLGGTLGTIFSLTSGQNGVGKSYVFDLNAPCFFMLPDLTPSIFNDGTTLNQNTSRDNVIRIFNIGAGPTTGTIIFTVPKMLPAYQLTVNANETQMNVFGGTTVKNNDWTIVEEASRYVFTSKPGVVIAAGGFKDVGIKNQAVGIKNSTGNLSVQIVFGTGGGETPFNNNTDNNTYSTN